MLIFGYIRTTSKRKKTNMSERESSPGQTNEVPRGHFGYLDDGYNKLYIARLQDKVEEQRSQGTLTPSFEAHLAEQVSIQKKWDAIRDGKHPEGSLGEALQAGGRDEVAIHMLGRDALMADPNATPEWGELYDKTTTELLREKQGKPVSKEVNADKPASQITPIPVEDLSSVRSTPRSDPLK